MPSWRIHQRCTACPCEPTGVLSHRPLPIVWDLSLKRKNRECYHGDGERTALGIRGLSSGPPLSFTKLHPVFPTSPTYRTKCRRSKQLPILKNTGEGIAYCFSAGVFSLKRRPRLLCMEWGLSDEKFEGAREKKVSVRSIPAAAGVIAKLRSKKKKKIATPLPGTRSQPR